MPITIIYFILVVILVTTLLLSITPNAGSVMKNEKPILEIENYQILTIKSRSLYNNHYKKSQYPIAKDLEEIFEVSKKLMFKVEESGTKIQKNSLDAEYKFIFERLEKIIGKNYYLEIVDNPSYWENPNLLKSEVEASISLLKDDFYKNIRRFNASKEIDFKVALRSISSSVDDTIHNRIYDSKNDLEDKD